MEIQANQIFVRNLSYETTSDDLVALFQDIGPIKHAEVVKDDNNKGFFI